MEGRRTLETSFTTHDNKKIDVVYTNEEEIVVRVLRMYEGWLEKDEDKFVDWTSSTPRRTHMKGVKSSSFNWP